MLGSGRATDQIFNRPEIETLVGARTTGKTLTGNTGPNVLKGNTNCDGILNGSRGHDRLFADDGNHIHDGGTGKDVMRGGLGEAPTSSRTLETISVTGGNTINASNGHKLIFGRGGDEVLG